MRLSTKGRYAVMAMADLAGNATEPADPPTPGGAGRYRRAAGHFAVLSGAALRQAAPRRAGDQRARARRRLSPGAAVAANCASPTSSWRWTSPSPPPAASPAAPRAAPRPARAASPTICGKSWASRSMCSCRRFRWPMWWRSGCWAVRGPATISNAKHERGRGRRFRGGLIAMHYLRSQCDIAAASRMPGRDDARAWPSAAIRPRCMPMAAPRAPLWKTRATRWPQLAGAKADQVIFTSGATEANELALWGAVEGAIAERDGKTPASPDCSSRAIEHSSVLTNAAALAERVRRRAAGTSAGDGRWRARSGSAARGAARRQGPRSGGGDGGEQ